MKKGLVVILSVLVIGLFLSSCAKKAEEVGVTDTEIVIGSHQDLSGPIAGWGNQVKMGLEMRAKEINDAGGIHGRKIRLVIEDNGYDPKKAIMVTNKMITRDKVFCFIGNMGSPTAGATKPIISKKKIPQMFPLTAASLFFEPYDRYSFAGFTPYYDQARIIVKYFVKEKGYEKIGLMYQDDEMGAIMKKGVEDELAVHKLKLASGESYKRGATDFSSQIAKLRKADVQLVVLATVIRETVGALKEAKKIGWEVDMCGMSPAYTKYVPLLCMKAGFSADGFYCTGQTPMIYKDSPNKTIQEWWKRHVEWFGKDPDLPTTAGYAGVHYFAIAAERVGKDLTREKLVDELEKFREEPDEIFDGPPYTFTKTNHQGAFYANMNIVKGGKFVVIAPNLYFKKPQ
ncbi:MAG: ABC transporter substrate-binding protein [Deltaproteobacteria bacterium]|nr:ABC transporter substrate-binding protein [Deltaproteobacteria bacterium]